ncbi:hypothetical protein QBC46DRAFT_78857 [Diplogelasinospora grovesii]|uniref:Uncharacterized protein n=1 Tax=Diplogelasinospora grovesii TaxID=303347 RepID=A0AAN6NBF0_9PEZI|nr:hypothetical protein QBC46DRAFT_78857 [Diplogelasinospora grovesii]
MSSRIANPVQKVLLTRSISSTASIARPSHLLTRGAAVTSTANVRIQDIDPDAVEGSRNLSFASPHRPSPTAPTTTLNFAPKKVPLMQGFRTSAPKPARSDRSTIDFAVLPNLWTESANYDPYAHIRVPLLPDNTSPPAGARPLEQPDAPLPAPEILVVAANPEQVLPSALTEVEGMGVDGVELKFAHDLDRTPERNHELEGGMIRDLWRGLVDDVLGPPKPAHA